MISTHDPHTLIHQALQSLEISLEHSTACIEETNYWLKHDGLDDPQLLDLTHLPFVTIDNENSRDLDQAVHIDRTDQGYRVMYALADAAYYISPGSALFDEALKRGTSYYTPLLSAAMLPTALSEGLISLNPNVERRSLVFDISLDNQAAVTNCTIERAKIKSHAKLSYEGVQDWLDSDAEAGSATSEPFYDSLRLLKEVGIKLINAGEVRGIISFDRSETQIGISGSPPQLVPKRRKRFDTERYNEQLSLLCNMQGAEILLGLAGVSDAVQAVFRVHEAPLRKSLTRLRRVLDAIADTYHADERWRWKNGQSLAEFVNTLPPDPRHQRRVRAIQRQIMQAQRSSQFTPEPGEHHALKVCSYARFSSPMRELVGIFTHKELLEALNGRAFTEKRTDKQEEDNHNDEVLREQVIIAANRAKQKQRQLDKKIEFAALVSLFSRELELPDTPWHPGTLIGMRSDKLYISLDDFALDVKVYKDDLDEDWNTAYTFSDASAQPANTLENATSNTKAPVWQLGEGVKLRILSLDSQRQRLVFRLKPLVN